MFETNCQSGMNYLSFFVNGIILFYKKKCKHFFNGMKFIKKKKK